MRSQDLTGRRNTLTLIHVTFGVLVGTSRAHAQSAEAQRLFDDGNKLMADGKLVEACAAFEASNRIEPRAGACLRLGECREKDQQFASAWSAYKDAQNLATDPRKRQFATAKVSALEPRLSYLTAVVSNQARIPSLVFTRNDKPFDPMLWNRALPVDGGDYIIAVHAPGYETWQKIVHVPLEGAKISVDVPVLTKASKASSEALPSSASSKLPAASPTITEVPVPATNVVPQPVKVAAPQTSTAPPAHPSPPSQASSKGVTVPEAPPPPKSSTPPATSREPAAVSVPVTNVIEQHVNIAPAPPPSVIVVPTDNHSLTPPQPPSSKIVPLVVGAGAVALLGGGAGFELWAESKYTAAKIELASQSRRDSLYDSASTKRDIAVALTVGGAAAGGTAVWLYLRNRNRERDAMANASVRVVPTATGLALAGQF